MELPRTQRSTHICMRSSHFSTAQAAVTNRAPTQFVHANLYNQELQMSPFSCASPQHERTMYHTNATYFKHLKGLYVHIHNPTDETVSL